MRLSDRTRRVETQLGVALAAALGCACALAPEQAAAAERPVEFRIPMQPLGDALIAFGLQADVSVGSGDLARCGPQSRTVVGRMRPSRALARLLTGTGCTFTAVDARAYSIAPRPERVSAPARTAGSPATATAEPPTVRLLDLTVTTTRRPSLVSRTPASVSLASAGDLSANRIDSLQELAPEFAGVTVTNLGPGRNKILVRGLSDGAFTGRTQSTVGLYLDDVPITYNAPDPDLRLVDMERVEIMRGPQGTLYGVGSMGGVVRLVTAKPDVEAFDAAAAVGWATTEGGGPSHSVDLMANLPLAVGRAAIRAVAYQDVEGGYVDDIALGVFNANRTTRVGGRVSLGLLLDESWRLTIGGNHQSLRADDSQYAEGRLPGFQRDILTREPHDNDFTQGYATLEGSSRLGELKVSASYLVHEFKTRYDASTGLPVFESTSPFRLLDQSDRVRLAVAEAVLTSPSRGRLQWLVGLFGSRTIEDFTLDIGALEGGFRDPLYFEDRVDRLGEVAVYGEASYALTPSLTLTAGLRAFHAWLETDSFRDQGGETRTFSGSRSSQDVSPKLVLSWQPAPSRLFYVQAAQGYRTGGFNTTGRITQRFDADGTGNQPDRRYRPDTLWSAEIGAKLALAGNRLQLRSALFYNDWQDVQSDQFLPSGLPYTANVGRGANTGLETEVGLHAGHGLDLRLSFLANSPELRKRDPTYPARPNASLPAVPRYSAALVAEWRRPVGFGLEASLAGRIAYVGASVLTFQEQASSSMGDYVTARIAAALATGRWRFTAFVDNPGDIKGDTFAFGDPFTQGRVRQFTPLRPRTFGVSLSRGL
jgi:outer membrane receptor protein involved in Fe transport